MSEVTFGQLESWGSGASSSGGDREDFLHMKDNGTYQMRVVGGPPHEFRVHWATNTEGKMRKVRCAGRDCILCKEDNDPQTRYMSVVINRDVGRVQAYEFTVSVYKELKRLYFDDDWGDPSNYDIKVIKDTSQEPRKIYTVSPKPTGMGPITDEEAAAVKEFMTRVDLDKLTTPAKNKEIERALGRAHVETVTASDNWKTNTSSADVASQSTDVSNDEDFDF